MTKQDARFLQVGVAPLHNRQNSRQKRPEGLRAPQAALWSLAFVTAFAPHLTGCDGSAPTGPAASTAGASASSAGNGSGAGGSAPGSGGGTPITTCTAPAPGAAPLRRLTRFELNNTVRDLLGDTSRAADALPPELKGNGFNNDAASLTTSRVLVDGYHTVAQALATQVASTPARLAALATCDLAAQDQDACAKTFIANFGRKAFRRSLTDAESATFYRVYQAGKEGTGYVDGVKAVIELALQSPQFLYRIEHGTALPGQAVWRPSGAEMATRLSYLLWGSLPDEALLDKAAAGGLDSKEQVLSEAKLMLESPKAHDVVRYFTSTLYGIAGLDALERSTELFPTYTRSLGPLFRQETERFIDHVVWEGAGDFSTLFSAPYTFVNGPLAAFYGLPGVSGDAFQRVERDPSKRLGLLSHASVLASTTPGSRNNPVVRGKFIYEELFCEHVPSPPVGLNVKEPPADPTRTTRERFSAHREMEPCKTCHAMLDPIGFGLENFDGVGLWRETENGKPIDASGELPDVDVAGPFNGPAELAQKIAGSADARNCFADRWLAFAYGRVLSDGDACTRAQLESAFRDSGGNVKALLLAATQTDAFLYMPARAP
ncbi:MAG TPA: DUF1592 domain-containing protein [Polyangiaceae bacterium]|nr:DUF1592 domain-containing protein [Polyangiaceae bacterium]